MLFQVVTNKYLCSNNCESYEKKGPILKGQLAYRFTKLNIQVLRLNIGNFLTICVPDKTKWTEFGWDGKTVDEIMDDLLTELSVKKFIKNLETHAFPLM